ncbi:MAG: DUF4258 domain-containing protein [Desulfobacteraceae bacterium]|nr:MAG: DUF4258 domain-containing protein [Desulfobacteraceae bacterium]
MEFTKHFKYMVNERKIREEWINQTLNEPDRMEQHEDGTIHFIKRIPENGGRWLRIVINSSISPNRAITAFFDRRLRRSKNENQSR